MNNEFITDPMQIDYLKKLRNPTDELTGIMEDFAAQKKIPILDWKSAELLEQLIEIKKPLRVLEIGTAIGYSSIIIARSIPENGILDTIEISKHNIPLAIDFISKAGLTGKINLIEGDALKVLSDIQQDYDFIFLDADKEDYPRLFELSLQILKKDGIIFVDNLLWHSYAAKEIIPDNYKISTGIIKNFNLTFTGNSLIKANIYPIGDGIGIGIKL